MADLAVICGATGGLGPAVVRAFEGRGDRVVPVSRDVVDLGDPDAVERFWEGLPETPRWLVNVAGGFSPGSLGQSSPESLRHMLRLNLETCWWSCRAAARRMRGGAIVNVSSRAAVSGGAGSAAYAVAKAGVVRLSEVLAVELKPAGVRVNCVMPALIDTAANRAAMTEPAMRAAVAPEAIAAAILWLCSDDAAAVTGAVVPV